MVTFVAVFGIIIYEKLSTDENNILITDLGSIQHTILDQPFNYPENPGGMPVKIHVVTLDTVE